MNSTNLDIFGVTESWAHNDINDVYHNDINEHHRF